MDWIGTILQRIRDMECPNCGARLEQCAVRGITAEPRALVVRLACAVCGESSVATVERDAIASTPPLDQDDVLDAHEFLKRCDRPVSELIAAGKST